MLSDYMGLWRGAVSCGGPWGGHCWPVCGGGPSTDWIYGASSLRIEFCTSAWEAPMCSRSRVQDGFSSCGGRPRERVPKDGSEAAWPEAIGVDCQGGYQLALGVMAKVSSSTVTCSFPREQHPPSAPLTTPRRVTLKDLWVEHGPSDQLEGNGASGKDTSRTTELREELQESLWERV